MRGPPRRAWIRERAFSFPCKSRRGRTASHGCYPHNRIGIDDNGNGVLDPAEYRPTATTFDIVSFTHAYYEDNRSSLTWKVREAWLSYPAGTSLLCRFLNRSNAPLAFDLTNNLVINCLSQGNLTHNAGAAFDASGNTTLALYIWNVSSEASAKISESIEIEDIAKRILANHAQEVLAHFNCNPNENEYAATWTTNNVPINFATEHMVRHPDEYDLHVAFGNAMLPYVNVGIFAKRDLSIKHLTMAGRLEDLYDFDCERGGLNSTGAVLQIGWDAGNSARDAGNIFFDRVDFGKELNKKKFGFGENSP